MRCLSGLNPFPSPPVQYKPPRTDKVGWHEGERGGVAVLEERAPGQKCGGRVSGTRCRRCWQSRPRNSARVWREKNKLRYPACEHARCIHLDAVPLQSKRLVFPSGVFLLMA
jgi:hypothetical protein